MLFRSKTFAEGGVDEIVSTRRLIHIVKAFSMFKRNRVKAIELCVNRFDEETKSAFMDLYNKVDKPEENQAVSVPENEADTQKQPRTDDLTPDGTVVLTNQGHTIIGGANTGPVNA